MSLQTSPGLRLTNVSSGFQLFGTNLGSSSIKPFTNYVDGSPAQLLTVAAGADLYAIKTLENTAKYMATAGTFGIWIYIPDQQSYDAIVLDNQGGSVGVYADLSHNDFAHLRSAGQTRQNLSPDISSNMGLGWNFINLTVGAQGSGKDYTDNTALTPWSTPQTGIGFRVLNGSTKTIQIGFGTMCTDARSATKIVWTMDDAVDNQYTVAYQKLSQVGIKASILTIPANIGQPGGWCTLPQLKEMHDVGGWDIVNHTQNHINIATISTEQTRQQLTTWKAWADANGFWRGADIFGYPQGGFNGNGILGVQMAGYYKARSTIQKSFNCAFGVDKMLVPSYIMSWPTLASVYTGYIDTAIAKGESIVLYFHELVTTPVNGNQLSIADFNTIVDYAVAKQAAGLCENIQLSKFFDYLG